MIQIVIPAAGEGSRFKEAGYDKPKHLIDVMGRPMIDRVVKNIQPNQSVSLEIVTKDMLTNPSHGAVETILNAHIEDDQPLLIANCDQLVDINPDAFVNTDLDGCVAVFKSNKPHHSYVTVENGVVTEIKEKEVISNHAVSGVYYFKNGQMFKEAARRVVEQNKRFNNEFYVSTVIDELVKMGYKLGVVEAPTAILGTPEELQLFLMAAQVAKEQL